MRIEDYLDKSKIFDREIDRLTYARDASIYRILPEFAVRPKEESDIQKLFEYAHNAEKSITFRASGTSLSGQTVTNGIIAEIAYDWQKIEVRDNGSSIVLEPGVIGEHANQALIKYQKRIGPDPASMRAARIGGIIANNASGMTTGKPCNSYNTLRNIRFILPNGNIYDTSLKEDYKIFEKRETELFKGLQKIREVVLSDDKIYKKIIDKYRLKNTIGYSMNSFIDHEHPMDIFAHLLIGSEGTLAFVSKVELSTVPDPPYKSTGLVFFNDIKTACLAIEPIKNIGIQGLELMDYACLQTVRYYQDLPFNIEEIKQDTAALLCEFQEFDVTKFDNLENQLKNTINKCDGELIGKFARDEETRLKLWRVRKNLFTTVGSMRKPGTSIITEDLCFDIKDLGDAISDLHLQFKKWNYQDAVVFGHAKDGNLHFNLSIDLGSESGIQNYHKMIDEIVNLTIDQYNGSLKAEHGTGRNMAPYVEREWGSDIYNIICKIKELADPQNILNNGVILNRDNNIHTKNLKPMPLVNDQIDLCVECGFCEPVCPSRKFTFTPRNRISVAREISTNINLNGSLIRDLNFNTDMTCAVDGMCEIECPVGINTGEYIKEIRGEKHNVFGSKIAEILARYFKHTSKIAVMMLRFVSMVSTIFGRNRIENIMVNINKIFKHKLYAWNSQIVGNKKENSIIKSKGVQRYIYYPSCISRTIGADEDGTPLNKIVRGIATECNIDLFIPVSIRETCCGTPFSSKGFESAEIDIFEKTINILYEISEAGKYPIVIDTSPCTYKFLNPNNKIASVIKEKWKKLKFIDIIVFLNIITLERKDNLKPLDREIVIHPTCSSHKMNNLEQLKRLAKRCAKTVVIPDNSSCCGFAGDRGLIVPEMSKNAANFNKSSLNDVISEGYSSSRMCEIGMSNNNQNYRNIAFLVHDFLNLK